VSLPADLLPMERFTRLLGIGLLVALAALSVGEYQRTLESASKQSAPSATSLADTGSGDGRGDEHAAPPEYLHFTAGIRSGVYEIADLPSSKDRDVEQSTSGRDPSDPVETDIVPQAGLNGSGELAPGLYATAFGVEDCSFELRRIMKTKKEAVIGRDRLDEGRMLVSINEIEPDSFSAVPQCGRWMPWSPVVEPLTVIGDGDYWIGDLKTGTWDAPHGCIWEKVVSFRGAKLWDVQDSGYGPQPLVVDDETLGVRIRGCDADFVYRSAS